MAVGGQTEDRKLRDDMRYADEMRHTDDPDIEDRLHQALRRSLTGCASSPAPTTTGSA